jgi:two-component system, chemotaxis family, chemotaxis protein CheY
MSATSKSVLIVDDMKTIRMKLKQVCKDLGIQVVYEAMDGVQALEMLQGVSVDLVLSDWNMPNMTGIELVGKIRENPKLSQVPVIFITSENEKGAILKSLMSGVTDYIVKPFPDAIVKQKICMALKIAAPKN